MHKLNKVIESMFASDKGRGLYNRILDTISRENMLPLIEGGVLLGFSGGADSVFLLCFLIEFKRRNEKDFAVLPVHVNHSIRKGEAKRDEDFSRTFADSVGVDSLAVTVDVPAFKEVLGISLEETARNARYSVFHDIISSRNNVSTIAVAHNASDNAETVLFNILRGSGISGVCGIKPKRENIIRPIISISKPEIVSILDEFKIPYVVDSTNLTSDYTRNYIRNEIMPKLMHLSGKPEIAFTRMTNNLRLDLDYLNQAAESFIENECQNKICASKLRELHPSIFARVLSMIIHKNTDEYPEEKHISKLVELLKSDNFKYSLPGEYNFVCERGLCYFVAKNSENMLSELIFSLHHGENKISGTNLTVYVGEIDKSSLFVYNFSIQASLSSDIIIDDLALRFKSAGDSYKYGGITHKLKKVFNDRNIPASERGLIPILTDSRGILVVPGMSVRDGAKGDSLSDNIMITFAYSTPIDGETEVFTALLRK